MWPFHSSRHKRAAAKDREQTDRIRESQLKLLHAATSTADAAHGVTIQLKQHLEDSIRQFENTVRILTDGLIVCNSRGNVEAINPAAERLFGSTSILHTCINNLIVVDGQLVTPFEKLWESINDASSVIMGRRANGELFTIEITTTPLDRSNGSVLYLLLIRDLTDQIKTQKAFEIHEIRSRVLFNVSFDGILIIEGEHIIAANDSAGRVFGRSPESLLSVSLDDLVNFNGSHPIHEMDEAPGFMEVETLRNDGTSLQLMFSSTPIIWNDVEATLLTVKDVSEMKRLEIAVRSNRENGVDMIVCFSPDFMITFANTTFCAFYGADRDTLVGTDVRALFSESERATFLLNVQNLSPTNPTRRMQVQLLREDGNHLQDWLDHANFDQQGKLLEYQRSGRDITEILQTVLSQRED